MTLGLKKELKILFVTSERAPFAKVGGLGEVMFSLPRALKSLGHDARVMMPHYGTIDKTVHKAPYVMESLGVPSGHDPKSKKLICNVRKLDATKNARSPVTTYFLENQEYYELRSNVYGYADDTIRFALLSRGCLEFLEKTNDWLPDIIVSTDWMTGYIPNYLKHEYKKSKKLKDVASVLTIHNLGSQGMTRNYKFIPPEDIDDANGPIPGFFDPKMNDINSLKRGIKYADLIITVSPTYAKEIMTPEFGAGLDDLLRTRKKQVYGILNGIDYETNNPKTDPLLAENFSPENIEGRDKNKTALQEKMGLPQNKDAFVCGLVSRLTRQKGISLFDPVIESFLKESGGQLVVVGEGDTEFMDYFRRLEEKFPDQVRAKLQFDATLPHLIFAGADTILIPSKFEPSGLTQMEAMRFGAIPIARRVGGLADSIEDFNPKKKEGTGFLFDEFDPSSFLFALTRAYTNWRHKDVWRALQKKAMEKDFSWTHSAQEYVKTFKQALKKGKWLGIF